eukprot:CAMPEP_0170612414 /NCGR_PEP_ID=MMETSP0224-20130122/23712_1 /TAXON_ID=285029 /ORGANISM="Togula jolla, Strain CCCM 725" /LENGTH=33 /DNA_ID= /DNA_START= /DNA_END= /DNA_ORIENTATION=
MQGREISRCRDYGEGQKKGHKPMKARHLLDYGS